MPRILLSAAHIAPLILETLGIKHTQPSIVAPYPPLPHPFEITKERVEKLQKVDADAIVEGYMESALESATKPFCNEVRSRPRVG